MHWPCIRLAEARRDQRFRPPETTSLTQATCDRLVAELEDLTTRGRVEIAQAIESARALGDLSENGDYQAAKDAPEERADRWVLRYPPSLEAAAMRTEATLGPEELEHVSPGVGVEPPLYRSRFGGWWTDRRDAHEVLEGRRVRGEVTDADAELMAHYIDHGYVILEQVTDEPVIDEYLEFFEVAWNRPPDRCWLQWNVQSMPMDRKFHDEVTKVGSLHLWFDRAGELIFPQRVLRFLTQIYDRPPVTFQTLTLRKGSQENLHIDTGPLTLTEPMSLAGSWVALEDVQLHSGEFQFIPGSHRSPELLHYGTGKGHQYDYDEYYRILQGTHRMCEERGLETKTFMAKKGDVLIWYGDLMHGGAPIQDQTRTRKSLIAHLMPSA